MPKKVLQVRVFVACPADVEGDIKFFPQLIRGLNNSTGKERGIILEQVHWRSDTIPTLVPPDIKGQIDLQGEINKQIGDYDIFIGILAKRFGTPTVHAESGTEEEFEKAYNTWLRTSKPDIKLYFKKGPHRINGQNEAEQYALVAKFINKAKEKGLIGEYSNTRDLEGSIRQALYNAICTIGPHEERQSNHAPLQGQELLTRRNERGRTLIDNILDIGLVDIENRNNRAALLPPETFLRSAKRDIAIGALSASRTFHDQPDLLEELIKKGISISFLILHPDSPDLPKLALIHRRDIESDIKQTIETIKLRKFNNYQNFSIRFRDTTPSFVAAMIDGDINPIGRDPMDLDGQIRVQPMTMYATAHEGLMLQLAKKIGESIGAFDFFSQDLREQWRIDGKEITEFFK